MHECQLLTNTAVTPQANQEKTQQQLTKVRAASKASDSSRAQANLQHQAQLADLHHQLEAARQCTADLQAQHHQELSQQLASAAAAAADTHKGEMETLRSEHTASCHQQAAAMEMLQREVALLTQETEHAMSGVAEEMSALHGAASSSQSELQSQLQQLRTQVAAVQSDSSSVGSVQEALHALMDIRQQLDAAGCDGVGPLLQEYQQLQAQVSCASVTGALKTDCLWTSLRYASGGGQEGGRVGAAGEGSFQPLCACPGKMYGS